MRTTAGFRVKLHTEGWNIRVGYSFAGFVIYIYKAFLCIWWKRRAFDRIAMILGRDEAMVGSNQSHVLVVTAVAVL